MHLSDDFLTKWETIIGDVEKTHVPVETVHKAVIRFSTGGQKTINIRRLRDQGLNGEEIEAVLDRFVEEHQEVIKSMEFVLDVKAVAEILQPHSDDLLRKL